MDEHVPRLRKPPDCKAVLRASLFTKGELKTFIACNEGFLRYDMQDGLSARTDGPGGARIVRSIGDPVDANGWSSSRVHMVESLLPHLRQYVRVRSALVDAEALEASFAEFLDNTRIGVVQLDALGQIVEMNDSAREVLLGSDGLSDEGGELLAA